MAKYSILKSFYAQDPGSSSEFQLLPNKRRTRGELLSKKWPGFQKVFESG